MRKMDERQRRTEARLAVGRGGRAAVGGLDVIVCGAGSVLPRVACWNTLLRWSWR
jgi:hypothetical protein